jgi:hypothetical protein
MGILGFGAAGAVATAGGGMHWDGPRTPQKTPPRRGRGLSVGGGGRRGLMDIAHMSSDVFRSLFS